MVYRLNWKMQTLVLPTPKAVTWKLYLLSMPQQDKLRDGLHVLSET